MTAALESFSRRRASLVVGNRFGIFAARHDKYALGWLDRMARALETRPLLCLLHRWPENAASRTACRDDMCRDDCRTVVAPAFAAKNFRHLAGTKAKARWNATTTADAPTATDNAKWDPRRVGYYRGRFQEETACLRAAARQKRKTDKGPSPESKVQSRG